MKILITKIFRNVFVSHWRYWLVFCAGIIFAIVCFVAINITSKPFSTSQYCGNKCHEMNDVWKSWQLSSHYANEHGVVAECIDCHLPGKDKFFTHMAAKTYAGAKDIYKHHFGPPYDGDEIRKKVREEMPNSRCLKCHGSLLVKPGSSAARLAHQQVFFPAKDFQPKCVDCHEQLHQRQTNIFLPD